MHRILNALRDTAITTQRMRHVVSASDMKRTFWMHENAKECKISRMQQVKKCIKMTVSHRKNAAARSGKMRSNETEL